MERQPGSYVLNTEGKLEPNLDDEAMKSRHTPEKAAEQVKIDLPAEKKKGGR